MKHLLNDKSIFRTDLPSTKDVAAFHRDDYVIFPEVFTAAGLQGLIDEILVVDQIREFLELSDEERGKLDNPYGYFLLPWNDKGPWADQLIDAPVVKALLQATTEVDFHFCHSGVNVSLRGSPFLRLHQDHHHWKHDNPVNLAERDGWYLQMLYYPNGFKRGDKNLSVPLHTRDST